MVLYFHGGGFILGGLDSHDDVCAELCGRTGDRVVSVDYRLAPEHLHPAASTMPGAPSNGWLSYCADPLSGDCAGGNLAAAVSHATRGHARGPAGQVLIYPGLGGESQGLLCRACRSADADAARSRFYKGIRTGGGETGDITIFAAGRPDFAACRRLSLSPPNAIRCPPTARPMAAASRRPAATQHGSRSGASCMVICAGQTFGAGPRELYPYRRSGERARTG